MDGKYRDGIRDEVKKCFETLQKLFSGNSEYVTRSERLDAFTKKEYYTLPTEMAARAFGDYVSRQLEAQGQVNDFLSNQISETDWKGEENTYPYPTGEDAVKIGDAMQSLFNTLDEKTDESGSTVLFSMVGDVGSEKQKSLTVAKSSTGISQPFPDYRGLPSDEKVIASAALQFVKHIYNIASGNSIVKNAVAKIKTMLEDIENGTHIDAKSFITKMNEAGFVRSKEGGSAYLQIDNKSTARLSNHSATASTFVTIGEKSNNISIVLRSATSGNKEFKIDDNVNLLELQFGRKHLDKTKLPILLADIAHFMATGDYIDNVGAVKIDTSGSGKFKLKALEKLYIHYLKQNNIQSAEKAVKEAAKQAGYITIAYHGTNAEFYVFDKGKFGLFDNGSKFRIAGVDKNGKLIIHTIKDEGFFFSALKSDAEDHANGAAEIAGGSPRTLAAYLKLGKPLIVEMDKFYAEKKGYNTQDWYDKNTAKILDEFHKGDYDSIWVKNPVRPTKDNLYIVFESEQIKSADPVTYDDNGNIIPLSERFNQEKNDIRFSKSDRTDPSATQAEVEAKVDKETDKLMEPKLTAGQKESRRKIITTERNIIWDTIRHIGGVALGKENWLSERYTDNRKNDIGLISKLLVTPIHLARKYAGTAVESIVNAALDLADDRIKAFNYIDKGVSKAIKKLRKTNKAMYQALNKYLLKCDINQTGAGKVKSNKAGTKFTAIDIAGEVLGEFDSMDVALDVLFLDEAKRCAANGTLDTQAAGLLMDIRKAYRRALLLQQSSTLRKMRELGLEDAILTKEDFSPQYRDDMPDQINLVELLMQMGNRSTYYFPRRRIGNFQLLATKKGVPAIRKAFTNSYTRALAARDFQKKGYQVSLHRTNTSADMIHKTDPMALSDILNQAMERAGEALKEKIKLKDFDYTRKDGSIEKQLVLDSEIPMTKRMQVVIEKLGGRFYDGMWHFANPTADTRSKLQEVIKKELSTDIRANAVMRTAVADSLVEMIRENGSSSSKIARRDAKGDDVVQGYIDNLEDAYNIHISSISGGVAKNIMAKKMFDAWNGMDFDRDEFINSRIPKGLDPSSEEYKAALLNATTEYYKEVSRRAINSAKTPELAKYMDKYIHDMLRNASDFETVLGIFKGVAAVRYLSSFRSSLGNLFGMIATVPAEIVNETGVSMAYALQKVNEGLALYGKFYKLGKYGEGSKLDPLNHKIMTIIHDNGWDGADMTSDAAGAGKHAASKWWKTTSDVALIAFGLTEQFNRAASIYASLQALAKQRNIDLKTLDDVDLTKLVKEARRISDLGNGVYNKANKPTWARGSDLAAVADAGMLFQTYTLNYFNMMAGMLRKGHLAPVMYMTAATWLLGGVGSNLPGALLMSLIGGFFNPDDEEDNDEYLYNLRFFFALIPGAYNGAYIAGQKKHPETLRFQGKKGKKLVEVAGVEPASRRGLMKTSTCLFHLQLFFVLSFANGQAIPQNRHSLISQKTRMPELSARVLNGAAYTLVPNQAQRRGGIMPPEQTLRSHLLF